MIIPSNSYDDFFTEPPEKKETELTEVSPSSTAEPSKQPEYYPTTKDLDFSNQDFNNPSPTGNTIIGEQNINIGTIIEAPKGREFEDEDSTKGTLENGSSEENMNSFFPSYGENFGNYNFDPSRYGDLQQGPPVKKDDQVDDALEFLYPSYLEDKEDQENYEYKVEERSCRVVILRKLNGIWVEERDTVVVLSRDYQKYQRLKRFDLVFAKNSKTEIPAITFSFLAKKSD